MAGQSGRLPSPTPAGADSGRSVGIGRPAARLEDDRLLRGSGRYVSDLITTSDALRVKVLRSPHAHARILAIDATVARTLPGVAMVLSPDNLASIGVFFYDWAAT